MPDDQLAVMDFYVEGAGAVAEEIVIRRYGGGLTAGEVRVRGAVRPPLNADDALRHRCNRNRSQDWPQVDHPLRLALRAFDFPGSTTYVARDADVALDVVLELLRLGVALGQARRQVGGSHHHNQLIRPPLAAHLEHVRAGELRLRR
jgi:hypothetical protein